MAARTAEERIALIDAKIAKKKEEIKGFGSAEAEAPPSCHHAIRHGKSKAAGLTAEQIAEKLGLEM